MIKKTIYITNPTYLSLSNNQLVLKRVGDDDLPIDDTGIDRRTIPIEDIGVVLLENRQITITSACISALIDNNVALISCDDKFMPDGLMFPLSCNTIQNERFRDQLESSLPLKKQLWQQTVEQKIRNQAAVLKYVSGEDHRNMIVWSNSVKSGDSENMEARAAAYYWKNLFPSYPFFVREQSETAPNNMLNYGYAILRSIISRALVSSGLLPTLGIHHHNRYNAFCLADDIMEPYRPYVDKLVCDILEENGSATILTKDIKIKLLTIPTLDVSISDHKSPLMVAASTTTASLARCFSGLSRNLIYPEM